jgi:endogenous inhibitor of DNA gyrase (YacG/DUF329 family)
MTTAQQRACPRCGRAFTWTTAAPRQKFCGNRCRSAYNRNPARYAAGPVPPGPANSTATTPGTTTTSGTVPGDGTITAVRACPHCGKPITAITWIVPPAAAAVTTPSPTATRRHSP